MEIICVSWSSRNMLGFCYSSQRIVLVSLKTTGTANATNGSPIVLHFDSKKILWPIERHKRPLCSLFTNVTQKTPTMKIKKMDLLIKYCSWEDKFLDVVRIISWFWFYSILKRCLVDALHPTTRIAYHQKRIKLW